MSNSLYNGKDKCVFCFWLLLHGLGTGHMGLVYFAPFPSSDSGRFLEEQDDVDRLRSME